MVWNIDLSKGFVCAVALWFGLILPVCKARIYTNHWAVRITGGPEDADRIAGKYGYKNMGQIGDLKDYYHFYHSRTIKRSTLSSRGRHNFISMEPKVEWIQQQVVKRRIKRDYKASAPQSIYFNDPKWTSMWYIHCSDDIHNCQSDMNIVGAWKRGYTGKDVVVTILDDGIERNHPDLIQNYDTQASYDVNGNDLDPMPRYDASNENKHGTRCAGEVAASANNSHCTVGIAYNAKIGGVRMLDGDVTDMVEAKSLSLHPQHIDIYSASWGPDDDGKTVDGPASLARQAFENGIRSGRKGRGSIFVWASGNGGRSRDHCSCDGYTNSIYTISISSTAESGKKPWYLEECSSTLTTTYSSGENYDRKIVSPGYARAVTGKHSGLVQAVAPFALAGIIALALEANPLLTWRDVQHIIVKTSRAGHLNAPDWKINAAGHKVSHLYGFGLMDAEAMVKEAERWKQVPPQHICLENADRQIRIIRPEHIVKSVYKATGCVDNPNHHVIYLEHVVVRVTITHPRRGDLSIYLTSPSGTKSQLLANRLFDHSMEGFKNWEFMTTHCWGEKAAGDWILEIHDTPSQLRSQKVPGKLKEWSLVLYGTSVHPYSFLRHEKPRSADVDEEDCALEEYSGPCDPECSENRCEGPGPHQCINCLNSFMKFKNNTRTCVSECPSGFFKDDKKRCKKCYSLCETCVGSRSDQCSSCKSGYYLNEETNSCVSSCPESFYLDNGKYLMNGKNCRKCSEHCKKCTSSQICTECRPGMSLQGNKCVVSCDLGSYYNGHRKECEPCHRACATCAGTGSEACTKCAENYYMEEWRCVSNCSPGYYLEQVIDNGDTQSICKKCDPSCYSCTGPGERNCSSCVSGYNLESGVCVVSTICKDGQYLDDQGKCHLCDATCYKCTGPDKDNCISCTKTRYFDGGHCLISCPKGKYPFNGQCHKCHHTCKECNDGEPYNCTSCDTDKHRNDRYYFQGECKESCPEHYYHSIEQTCEPCPANCKVCTRADRCLKCDSGFRHIDGKCEKQECGEGEVEDPDYESCETCEEGCQKCALHDPRNCSSCREGFYRFQTRCYRYCPAKTYNVDDNLECKECGKNCISCDANQCYWCEERFFLSDDECVERCDDGLYGDQESQECKPCHQDCRTCGGPYSDDCDSCPGNAQAVKGKCKGINSLCDEKTFLNVSFQMIDNFITIYLFHASIESFISVLWQNSCKILFLIKHSFFPDNSVCQKCHPSCKTCSGPEESECNSCDQGRFLTAQQTCFEKCPSKTFADVSSWKCEDCKKGCAECIEKSQCLKCLAGEKNTLYLFKGKCVTECPRGYFEDFNNICSKCSPECKSCMNNSTYCLSCTQQYVLYNHECGKTCPTGYFPSNGICQRCPTDCKECSSNGTCTECDSAFFLHKESCVDECPLGYYADTMNKDCQSCHQDCAECNGPDEDDCDKCANLQALKYNGACVQKCPEGTYYDLDSQECRDCYWTCGTCSDPHSTSCTTCREGMQKSRHGHCVPMCSYKDQEGRCGPCHTSCHLCAGPSEYECLSCNKNYYLLNHTCVDQCPLGYYSDKERNLCDHCHMTCQSCSGKHSIQCLTCKPGFYRQGEECVISCRIGYYANVSTGVCEKCDPSCEHCVGRGNTQCLSCHNEPNLKCEQCHSSCTECKGPGPSNCTLCHATDLLSPDGQCLECCDSTLYPQPMQCCNCTETTEECLVKDNYVILHTDYAGKPGLFITTFILLILGIGGAIFLFLRSRSKDPPTEKSGYEKLGNSTKSASSFESSSASRHLDDHVVEFRDRTEKEEEDDDEDEDIVYMGQDGTVYRKFKYGLLEDDDDEELEYDDESYSFR
ncbi:PCSK5 convertase, partial [Atractosteus spatula]|nr:PCSK5 convertase [Atractosteus spatula]